MVKNPVKDILRDGARISKFIAISAGIILVIAFVFARVIPNYYEAENNGTQTGGVIGADASTSGGQYVQFTDAGDSWEFSDNVSSIAVMVTRSLYGTTFNLYIDGNYSGTFNTYDSNNTKYKQMIRIFNFIDGQNHTVLINHTGYVNPSGQKNIDLDAFIVNSSYARDQREFEDNWVIYNGNQGACSSCSNGAMFQLPNGTAYWTGYGSGKYLIIYTTHSPYGTYFNVSYNGLKASFDTYINAYQYQQKHIMHINTTDNNYLLTINNSGINNTQNNSLVDLDYFIFYPFDKPTNSSITLANQTNSTNINLTWTTSTTASENAITYKIYVQQYDNGSAFNVSGSSSTSVILDMSRVNHNHYHFYIEASDGYLESGPNLTSGFYYFDNKTANRRAMDAADFLLLNQNADGAIPDSPASTFYNSDNNMGYAMMALYYAWENTTNTTYIDAMGSALDFIGTKQDVNGTWQYAYKYNSGTGTYYPDVWDIYKASNITNISTVDAVQAYFAYDLWLYSMSNRNSTKVSNLTPVAEKGIQRLLTESYDGNRFFFSSWQYNNKTNNWSRFEVKYSAGQIDTFLGLMALWNLTGNETYLTYAKTLKTDLENYFWNTTPSIYVRSLDVNNLKQSAYLFSQGYILSVIPNLANTTNSYTYIKGTEQIDGSVNTTDAPNGETINTAVALLASLSMNKGNNTNLTNYLRKMQVDFSGTTNSGGFQGDKTVSTLSITSVGFAVPALLSKPLKIPNYTPKFVVNLTAQTTTVNTALSYPSNCSDLDGDTVTYSTNNSMVSINPSTGLITDTPTASDVGSHTITITCSDGKDNRTQSFTYSITAQAAATATSGGTGYGRQQAGSIKTSQEFTLEINDEIIIYTKEARHTIKLSYLGTDYARFEIYSRPLQIKLLKGERKTVDLDKDGTDDIAITLSQITSENVKIIIEPLKPDVKAELPAYGCYTNSECKEDNACFDHQCVKLFDIKIEQFESPVKTGRFFNFNYYLKGMANINGDVIINFWIENESGTVTSGSDTIYLGSFEEKKETTKIFLPKSISPGVYTFIITVRYGDYVARSHRTIEIEVEGDMATITPVSEYSITSTIHKTIAWIKSKYPLLAAYKRPAIILTGVITTLIIISLYRRLNKPRIYNPSKGNLIPQTLKINRRRTHKFRARRKPKRK